MVIGASLTFITAHVLAGLLRRPPLPIVALTAALAIAFIVRGYGRPQVSHWRVPVEWHRRGHVQFAGLFGFSLGVGFLTNWPSIGFPALVLLAAAVDDWRVALLLGCAFALGRVVGTLDVVARNHDRQQTALPAAMVRIDRFAGPVQLVELASLAGLIAAVGWSLQGGA